MGDRTQTRRADDGRAGFVGRAILVAGALGLAGPIVALVLSLPVLLAAESLALSREVTIVLLLVAGQWAAFGGLALVYLRARDLTWEGIRSYLGVRVPTLRELGVVVGGWLLIFGSLVAIGYVVQTVGADPAENQAGELARDLPALIPVLIVGMFLVVGPSEELLYRGVVQGRLREAMGPMPAIALASAIFAAIHWVALTGGATARLTTVAILFVPSLIFGGVYEYTGNLVVPALLHGLHNSILLGILYLSLVYGEEGQAILAPLLAAGALPA